VGKLIDRGYMDLGYSGFFNVFNVKKGVDAPTKGDMSLFSIKRKAIKDDDKKSMDMLETKAFYNYQKNKE
jgi:hypothetical protein